MRFATAVEGAPLSKRAAQYVRMSTHLQAYSIENQFAAVAIYAAAHGLTRVVVMSAAHWTVRVRGQPS